MEEKKEIYVFVKNVIFIQFVALSFFIIALMMRSLANKNFDGGAQYFYLLTLLVLLISIFTSRHVNAIFFYTLNSLRRIKQFLQQHRKTFDKITFAFLSLSVLLSIFSLFDVSIYSYLGIGSSAFAYFFEQTLKLI